MLLFNLFRRRRVVHGVVFIVDFLEFSFVLELSQFSTIPSGSRCAFRSLLHFSLVLLADNSLLFSFFLLEFINKNFKFIGWLLAWKLVLVHVPLVQEIFGLRKKPVKPKPPTRRLSRYYNRINSHSSTSQ
ncbi:hypothetical protein Goshw_025114 [Gossypium schwendimanii]|uniref:Uncharacterized protein n=1 Tax=Gossypium schwendimanii TaxID=34291 RepID=A0A7J9M8X5_GOSSC|nr:hypothetical protein [Gossypium schwendimanii]